MDITKAGHEPPFPQTDTQESQMSKSTAKKTEQITIEAQKTMEEGVETMTKSIETATSFGQENVEAVVASSKIATKAAETMGAEIAAYSKKAYEDSMAAAKELTSCKSVSDFFEKQTEISKTSIEGFVAEATKLNDMYAAAAKETFAPLNARITAAVETVKDYRV
jgi:phasin family protein